MLLYERIYAYLTQPKGDPAMKIIASGVIALSLIATVASIASAVDAKTFYEQQERSSY